MSEVPMESCPINSVQEIKDSHKEKGVFVVVTQDNCNNCAEAKKILSEECTGKKDVVEVPAKACIPIANDLGVKQTPTVFFYKGGKETRLEADGSMTWEQFRGKVHDLSKD